MPFLGNKLVSRAIAPIAKAVISAALCLGLLTACGGTTSPGSETGDLNTQAPIALTPDRDASAGPGNALTGPVDQVELRKAIERYRLTKQRGVSKVDFAGADLNGDGRAEAIVLFDGEDWCVQTGCSLVIFQQEETGYRPVSHVTRARLPVLIGPESNFGWRDLMVQTGGGPAPIKTVRLGFTGKGYPNNALLQPEPIADMLSRSQPLLAQNPAFAASINGQAGQPSAQ
jgi:hypothetical protein